MKASEIRKRVELVRDSLIEGQDDKKEKAMITAVFDLVFVFLDTQDRIASALERRT